MRYLQYRPERVTSKDKAERGGGGSVERKTFIKIALVAVGMVDKSNIFHPSG